VLKKLKTWFKLQFSSQKGAIQLPIIIGLLIIGVALPAAVALVQKNQETRRGAISWGPSPSVCTTAGGENGTCRITCNAGEFNGDSDVCGGSIGGDSFKCCVSCVGDGVCRGGPGTCCSGWAQPDSSCGAIDPYRCGTGGSGCIDNGVCREGQGTCCSGWAQPDNVCGVDDPYRCAPATGATATPTPAGGCANQGESCSSGVTCCWPQYLECKASYGGYYCLPRDGVPTMMPTPLPAATATPAPVCSDVCSNTGDCIDWCGPGWFACQEGVCVNLNAPTATPTLTGVPPTPDACQDRGECDWCTSESECNDAGEGWGWGGCNLQCNQTGVYAGNGCCTHSGGGGGPMDVQASVMVKDKKTGKYLGGIQGCGGSVYDTSVLVTSPEGGSWKCWNLPTGMGGLRVPRWYKEYSSGGRRTFSVNRPGYDCTWTCQTWFLGGGCGHGSDCQATIDMGQDDHMIFFETFCKKPVAPEISIKVDDSQIREKTGLCGQSGKVACVKDKTPAWEWSDPDVSGGCAVSKTLVKENPRFPSPSSGPWWKILKNDGVETTYTVSALGHNNCKAVAAKYENSAGQGESSATKWVQVDTQPPPAPGGLSMTCSSDQILFSWNPVVDNGCAGIPSGRQTGGAYLYQIATTNGFFGDFVEDGNGDDAKGWIDETSVIVNGSFSGTIYARVKARDDLWNVDGSWSGFEIKECTIAGPTGTPTPGAAATNTPVPSCPRGSLGNLDCSADGVIDETDFNIMLAALFKSPSSPHGTNTDLTGEGNVNERDLTRLVYHWGAGD